jgi:hypothetical protein
VVLTIFSLTTASCVMGSRTDHWIKVKNLAAPAVKREAEEDWSTLGKRSR